MVSLNSLMIEGLELTAEDLQKNWADPYLQWYAAGMPAFVTHNLAPWKQIVVKFPTMEDRQAFAERCGYILTEKTGVVWHPNKIPEKNNMNRIVE